MIQTKVHYPKINEIRRFKVGKFSELVQKSNSIFGEHYLSFSNVVYFYLDCDKDWIIFSTEDEFKQAIEFHDKSKGVLYLRAFAKFFTLKGSKKSEKNSESDIEKFVKAIPSKVDTFLSTVVETMVDEIPKKVENMKKDFPKKVEEFKKDFPKKVEEFKKDVSKRVEIVKKDVQKRMDELKSKINGKKKNKMIMSVHSDVLCDNCKCCPIIGKRYHCLNKKDFDLCEDCFSKRGKIGYGQLSFDVYEEKDMLKETYIPMDSENKYKDQLKLLSGMGFCDKELNIKLLDKYDGDVAKCVSDIIKM